MINIPDTVGYASPQEYGDLFRYLKKMFRILGKRNYLHIAMTILAWQLRIHLLQLKVEQTKSRVRLTVSVKEPEMLHLKKSALHLYIRKDFYNAETNLKLNEIKRTSQLVSKLTGMMIQANKAVVGKNAFAHESGIHQDGVLKEPTTYEIITPELIGETSNNLVLGKHSGRHAFQDRAISMGFQLDQDALNRAFKDFKNLADRKKEMTTEDLLDYFNKSAVKRCGRFCI